MLNLPETEVSATLTRLERFIVTYVVLDTKELRRNTYRIFHDRVINHNIIYYMIRYQVKFVRPL